MTRPAPEGARPTPHRFRYPWLLALAGVLVALAVLLPYETVPFERADGVVVRLPAPDRLNHTSDAFDYLQIARQVHRGCGYTSLFTYPPFLPESARFLAPGSLGPDCSPGFPVFWRQPGFPLLVAFAFALRGAADPAVLSWIQGVAIVLLPLATYLLGRRFLSPGWAALAGLAALLSPTAVSAGSPFVASTWFAVLLSVLVALVFWARRSLGLLALGMLLGVTALFRLETWILLPGLLAMFWLGRTGRRGLALVWVVVPTVLIVAPWHATLATLTGNPFYNASSLLYHATPAFPGWESSRSLAVRDLTPWGFFFEHPGDVLWKSVLDLVRFGRDLVFLPSLVLAPFLWLAVLRPPAERGPRAFLVGGTISVAALVLVLSPMEYAPRFLAGTVPLLAVGGVMGLSRLERHRALVVLMAILVGTVQLGSALVGRERAGTALLAARDLNRIWAASEGGFVSPAEPVILADAPTVYAWIWDRPAVWTPVPRDVSAVRALLPGNTAALFTRAGGRGDDLAVDTVEGYVAAGGRTSAAEPPLVVTWPASSAQGDPAAADPIEGRIP